jgi:hypothetical protein
VIGIKYLKNIKKKLSSILSELSPNTEAEKAEVQ